MRVITTRSPTPRAGVWSRWDCQIFCARGRFSSSDDEPVAEDHGELAGREAISAHQPDRTGPPKASITRKPRTGRQSTYPLPITVQTNRATSRRSRSVSACRDRCNATPRLWIGRSGKRDSVGGFDRLAKPLAIRLVRPADKRRGVPLRLSRTVGARPQPIGPYARNPCLGHGRRRRSHKHRSYSARLHPSSAPQRRRNARIVQDATAFHDQ